MSEPVRLAMGRDTPIVCKLLVAFRDHLGKEAPDAAELEHSVRKIIGDSGGEFLIGYDEDGDPAGVAQIRYRWSVWTSAEDCWLEDLYVTEAARRAGLGRALVDEVIDHARARGCLRVELDVDEDNEAALALYREAEFSAESKGHARSLLMGRPLDQPDPSA